MASPVSRIRFGAFELSPSTTELRKAGVPVKLHPQPFRVLLLLAERTGQLVTREEIRVCLWGGNTFVDFEHGINFCVNQIRGALGDDAEKPRFIETLPRRGYRFIAPISNQQPVEPANTPVAAATLPLPGSGTSGATVSSGPGLQAPPQQSSQVRLAPWSRKRALAMIVATILALTAFSLSVYRWLSHQSTISPENMQIAKLTDSGKAESVAISPDGRYAVYALRDRKGLGLRVRHVATRSDVQILPPEAVDFVGLTFSPDGNHIYFVRSDKNDPGYRYLYMIPMFGGPPQKLIADIDSPVSFSPDGHQFVFTRGMPMMNASDIRIANADGTGDHLLARIPETWAGFQPGADWSPDGKTIAVPLQLNGKRSGVVLYSLSVKDGSVRELYSSVHAIGRPQWLPRGDALLVTLADQSQRGQLWIISYPGGEARRLTNDLASYGSIDLARNANAAALVLGTTMSNIWVAAATDGSKSKQITSGGLPMLQVAAGPHGKVLALGGDGVLLTMNSDGSQRVSLAHPNSLGLGPIFCSPFVVFGSKEKDSEDLMRADLDGTDAKKLASGPLWSPTCVPDGKFVFYVALAQPQKIMQVPIDGGNSSNLARILGEGIIGNLSLSPDGKLLAYPFEVYKPEPTVKLAVVPVEGGPPVKLLNVPRGIFLRGGLLWSHDSKRLQYLLNQNGATNIWEEPLAGGEPKQLTKFRSGVIFDFDRSEDGKGFLLARGDVSSDVVLLSHVY